MRSLCLTCATLPANAGRNKLQREENGRFVPMLELPEKPSKPRKLRRTALFDRGWPANFIEGALEGFADAIDIAKISAWHLHQPESVVRRRSRCTSVSGLRPTCGGPVLETARVQKNRGRAVLPYLRDLGFEGVEVSSESMPTQSDIESDREFAEKCRAMGFIIHGEVDKFPTGDQVRTAGGALCRCRRGDVCVQGDGMRRHVP